VRLTGQWQSPGTVIAVPPTSARLLIGASVNTPDSSLSSFTAASNLIGPLAVRRGFSSGMISALPAYPAGVTAFHSFKSPTGSADITAGVYDTQMTALARSCPDGTYLTYNHEPENDQDAASFVPAISHVHAVMKAANANILVGPVYQSYWWSAASTTGVGKPGIGGNPTASDTWLPTEFDFLGLDIYKNRPQDVANPDLSHHNEWQQWYAWARPKAVAAGVKLCLVEYGAGVIPAGGLTSSDLTAMLAARLTKLQSDRTIIEADPQIGMWLDWYGSGSAGDWSFHDTAAQQEWATISQAHQ
jgi:hypothetical protein